MWRPNRNILRPRNKLWLPPLGGVWTPYSRNMGRRRCCCGAGTDCLIYAGDFSTDGPNPGPWWNVLSGAAPVVSGHVELISNSQVITVATHPDNKYTGMVLVTVDSTNMNAGDEVKLWVSYEQSLAEGYMAVFTCATAAGTGGSIKLYDGLGTLLDSVTQVLFKAGSSSSSLKLCWSGSFVYGSVVGDNETTHIAVSDEIFDGGYGFQAGFGSGVVSGVTKITSFSFWKYAEGSNGCPGCSGRCPEDCTAKIPVSVLVEWDGIIDRNGVCTDCANINSGSVSIPWAWYYPGYDEVPTDGVCFYQNGYIPISNFPNCLSHFPNPGDPSQCNTLDTFYHRVPVDMSDFYWDAAIFLETHGPFAGNYVLSVEIIQDCATQGAGDDSSYSLYQYNFGPTKPDCNSYTDPLTLTWILNWYENPGSLYAPGEPDLTSCYWAQLGGTVIATFTPS